MSQVSLFILTFFLILIINEKVKPFRYNYINKIAAFSYTIIIVTIVFVLISADSNFNFQESLCFCSIVFFNIIFYVVWSLKFINLIFRNILMNFHVPFHSIYNSIIELFRCGNRKIENISRRREKKNSKFK